MGKPWNPAGLLGFLFFLLSSVAAWGQSGFAVAGVVRDSLGAAVVGAEVRLVNAQQVILGSARTDGQGRFAFAGVPRGSYLLAARLKGFAEQRLAIRVHQSGLENLEVTLEPEPVYQQVTVTAHPGLIEDTPSLAQPVSVVTARKVEERAKTVIAQVANEEAGVHLQRTSPSIAGVFVRGLTGNKVNIFLDGVRYSTSAARGGINTFLDLVEPSNVEAVEILRGPYSAQYGSGGIGGSVQLLSAVPGFSAAGARLAGKLATFFNSADAGFGSQWSTWRAGAPTGSVRAQGSIRTLPSPDSWVSGPTPLRPVGCPTRPSPSTADC